MDKLTAKRKRKAVKLVGSGRTLRFTANEIGVSTTTIHRWVVGSGLINRRRLPRLSDEVKRTALELVLAGLSIQQASRRLGISWPSTGKLVREHRSTASASRAVGRPIRCGCGALVNVVPCVACECRKQRETTKTSQSGPLLPVVPGTGHRVPTAA